MTPKRIGDFAPKLRRDSGAWQVPGDRLGYAFSFIRGLSPMTNRVSYAPQDFQKMCKQAERDHESKKLVVLMERVKRQIAEREHPGKAKATAKHAPEAGGGESVVLRLPSRSAPFER